MLTKNNKGTGKHTQLIQCQQKKNTKTTSTGTILRFSLLTLGNTHLQATQHNKELMYYYSKILEKIKSVNQKPRK